MTLNAEAARWKNTGGPDISAMTRRERERDEVKGARGWRETGREELVQNTHRKSDECIKCIRT